MKTSVFKEAAAYLRSRRSRRSYLFVILCLAVAAGAMTALASDGCGQDYTSTDAVSKDGSILVTASYGSEAELPEDAVLEVSTVTPETDQEQYAQRINDAFEVFGVAGTKKVPARMMDIGFVLPDGTEVEPKAPVSVTVQFPDNEIPEETPTAVIHFATDGTEICSASRSEEGVTFVTDSFSPFAFILEGDPTEIDLTDAGITGLENGQLKLGGSYTYYNRVALGNETITWELPSEMTWTAETKEIKTTIKDKDGNDKEVVVGTITVGTDGKVTYTPRDDCPEEAYENADIANYQLSVPFTVRETKKDGINFPGIEGTISFEPRDLAPFVSDAKLTQDGVEIERDVVVVGEHYHYSVEFREKGTGLNDVFSTPMYFDLPDNVKCEPVKDQPIYDSDYKGGDVAVGWYSVDEKGHVTVEFDDEYLRSKDNLKMKMGFDLTVATGEDGKTTDFPWSDGQKHQFTTDLVPDATLKKTKGDYHPADPEGPYIDYKVELEITKGAVMNPQITDTMGKGLSYRDGSGEVHVLDEDGKDITDTLHPKPTLEKTPDGGWEVKDLPESLSKKQKVIVTYKSDVDFDTIEGGADKGNFSFTAENTAKFTGQSPVEGQPQVEREDHVKEPLQDKRTEKNGSYDKESKKLNWEIVVGSGSTDVRGAVVKDTLNGEHWIDGDSLVLKWKDAAGNKIKTYTIPRNDPNLKLIEEGGKIIGFEYTIPPAKLEGTENPFWQVAGDDDMVRGWQKGDKLELEYCTDYASNSDSTYGNTAIVDVNGNTFKGEDNVGIGAGTISKNGVESEDGQYMEYTVDLSIPSAQELAAMTGGPTGDNLSRFYIVDQLEFPSAKLYDEKNESRTVRYFVDNYPEDVKITATLEDETVVKFEEGEGGPGKNSFVIARGGVDYLVDGEDPEKKSIREFRIWFNRYLGGSTLDKSDSYWTLEQPCTLKITYKIRTDSKLYLEDPKGTYSDTDLTVRDVLDQGWELRNEVTAYGRKEQNKFRAEHNYLTNRPEFGVNKDAKVLENDPEEPFSNEIEYRVEFNAFKTDPETGEPIEESTTIDPKEFWLEDTFDSRLEYVPGSMQVHVYSPERRLRVQYGINEETEENVKIEEGADGKTKLTVRAEAFDKQIYVDAYNKSYDTLKYYMAHDNGDGAARPRDAIYIFVYKLRVKDEYNTGQAMHFNNDALVYYGGEPKGDNASADFTPSTLIKNGVHEHDEKNADIVKYTVEVNPGGVDMVTAPDPAPNPGRYTLTDHMDGILILRSDSVKVYRIGKNDDGSESLVELKPTNDQANVNSKSDYYVLQEAEGHAFKLILPDEQHLRIEYSADVNANKDADVKVENTIEMDNVLSITDTSNAEFKVDGTNASITGDVMMRLFKQDSETGNYIDDAEFALYSIAREGDTESFKATIGSKEYSFTSYDNLKPTAADGAKIGPRAKESSGEAKETETEPEPGEAEDAGTKPEETLEYYLLVETVAPNGYQPDKEPSVVVFGEKRESDPETVTVVYDGETYENLKVHYITVGDNIIVRKNTPDAYELPETGGNGSFWLYLLGSVFIMVGALALLYDRRLSRGRSGR